MSLACKGTWPGSSRKLAWNARESWPGMPGNPGPECPGILAWNARESWPGMPGNPGLECPGILARNARESWPGMPGNPGPECPRMRVSACRLEEKVTFCKLNSDSVRCANACKCAIRKIEVFLQCIVLDAFRYTLATSECVPLFLPKLRAQLLQRKEGGHGGPARSTCITISVFYAYCPAYAK